MKCIFQLMHYPMSECYKAYLSDCSTRHHIPFVDRRTCFHGVSIWGQELFALVFLQQCFCHYGTFWEKLCQNQPLCPEACRISEQQDAHMLLVPLHSKKNHIFSWSKSAFEPHKNLHLDQIDLYQWSKYYLLKNLLDLPTATAVVLRANLHSSIPKFQKHIRSKH